MAFDSPAEVARYYAALHAEHGDGPRAVGYFSPHGQLASFVQLARVDGLAAGARVLDVGCGLGAFKTFLDDIGLRVAYTGWDICDPLVAEARRRHPDAAWEVRDILHDPPAEPFDFVFASGTLTMRLPDHEAWVAAMIRALYAAAGRGLVFTMLSARDPARPPANDTYYVADPAAVLGMCFDLGGQVLLDHAELAHSFAVYVYRRNPAPVERLRAHLPASGGFGSAERAIVEHYRTLGLAREALEFVSSLPETADACDAAGALARELGDERRMIEAYRRAVDLEPGHGDRWRVLATALADVGRRHEALEVIDQALALPFDLDDAGTRRWSALLRAQLGR